jgi:hypothetical protein
MAQVDVDEDATPRAHLGARLALVGALALFALAVSHYAFHTVLYTDACLRRLFY